MTRAFVGLDLGTSGVKAIAVEPNGRLVAQHSVAFDFDRPHADWAETPPERWWDATAKATRQLVANLSNARPNTEIASVALSGQMHGSVFLDAAAMRHAGRRPITALSPALMWNDQRTEPQRAQIEQLLGGRRACVEMSGCPSLCGLTAPKLLWLREQRPSLAERLAGLCLPKDFLALQLTGVFSTDVGDASGAMLLDPRSRQWHAHVLDALEVDPDVLPIPVESGTPIGAITAWAAEATGLPEGVPVVIGSGDNQTAAVGAGVLDSGEMLMVLGTSGVVLAPCDEATPDLHDDVPGRVNLFCDATGRGARTGQWNLSGCMLSAAGSLEWARGVLAPDVSFEALLAEAAQAPSGCDGLLFLPYLTGERCPMPDPDARGGWIGLRRSHTRAHLVRAVIEGVSFALAQITDIVREIAGRPATIRVTGGGSKSALWRQVLADATQTPIVTLETDQGSALGAASLAAFGTGETDDLRALTCRWVRPATTTQPESNSPLDAARVVYDRLYDDLRAASVALSQAQRASTNPTPAPGHTT